MLVLAGALTAWLGWEYLNYHFGREAAKFNLAEMENMEAASVIYDREGREFGKIFIQNRQPVAWEEISPNMVNAVLAAEDNDFYKHKGVDWMGIVRAAITNYRKGKISQGASTVTQQLARNSFELRERTYRRKLLEIFLARRIEENFSKNEIMRLYLNRVYFGSGFYGVEAAAQGYFGVKAKDLNPAQAATLAGLLKSPQALSPFNNPEAAKASRDFVLGRMRQLGFLKRDAYKQELETPLLVQKRTNPFKVSYAVDLIRQQAITALGFDRAMNGGFKIYSTIDSHMQKAAEKAVRETLAQVEAMPGYKHETFQQFRDRVRPIEDAINRGHMQVKMPQPRYLQAAVLALDSSTGAILAMVGGRDFKHSEYNRAIQARRPVGTAFAPFVFAAAFQKGAHPGETVDDGCIDNRYVMVGGESGILGEWGVERADNEYEGMIPMREALAKGKNAATVRAGFRAGLDEVRSVAKAAGIASPLRNFANTFLGSSELTLEELTLGYTPFAAGGLRPQSPFLIDRIEDAAGTEVYRHPVERVPALPPEVAYQVHSSLEDALHRGTGMPNPSLGEFPSAGKTGTAYNFTDTYFIGYTSSVTCGVWVGFDRPTKIFRGAFGRDLAMPIWTDVMNVAAKELPAIKFPMPDTLKPVELCRSSGLRATPRCVRTAYDPATGREGEVPTTYTEFLTEAQTPQVACDVHGPGVRSYAKSYDEENWPRAQAAVDLSRVRPVAVNSPTLLGLTDVYGSVRPGSLDPDDIPVARAVAVNETAQTADPLTLPDTVPDAIPLGENPHPGSAPEAIPTDPPAPAPAPADAPDAVGGEPEVRRAEAARPLDGPLDVPDQAPTPPPIRF